MRKSDLALGPTPIEGMRQMKRLNSLVIVILLLAISAPAGAQLQDEPVHTWERAEELLHFHTPQIDESEPLNSDPSDPLNEEPPCPPKNDLDGPDGPIAWCGALIDSWDGLSLSVSMLIPKQATEPLPTVLYLHGLSSNRGEFGESAEVWSPEFNAEALARRGYAVIQPAARGMGGSCGLQGGNTGTHDLQGRPQPEVPHGPSDPEVPDFSCSTGWTHLAERDFEIKDWQYLLGLLVDAGVSDPNRLGVAGGSYGGAETWLLATSMPWLTPRGDRTIRLAAAVPMFGWTDLLNSFAPNGRANDEPDGGRSHGVPIGVLKESGFDALLVVSTSGIPFGGGSPHPVRFNLHAREETHSFVPGWTAFFQQGEPYDKPEGAAFKQAFRNKSALFADEYFDALEAGTVDPVPISAVQGWNDAFFPAVEALQMYRRLRAADPSYPISVFLGDMGHPYNLFGVPEVRDVWQREAAEFLDAYVLRGDGVAPADQVVSMSTVCTPGSTAETITAADWDSIHHGLLTLRGDGPLTTQSGPANLREELPTDPMLHYPPSCMTQAPNSYVDNDYDWPVPSGGFTLLGLPKVMADYELVDGEDATIIMKLWDVDQDDNRTLVTRGVYRLSLLGGDESTGKLKTQLFGNHYRFEPGHSIQLEITQTDRPYLRPDNFESTITYEDIKLELPTTEVVRGLSSKASGEPRAASEGRSDERRVVH